jgi:hypothetical protein
LVDVCGEDTISPHSSSSSTGFAVVVIVFGVMGVEDLGVTVDPFKAFVDTERGDGL